MKATQSEIDDAIRTGRLGTATVTDRTPRAEPQPVRYLLNPSENSFQADVIQLAKANGWLCYHTYCSKRSEPGFPDLTMVKSDRILCVELKTNTEEATAAQREWLAALNRAGVPACIWKPKDWSLIIRELTQ